MKVRSYLLVWTQKSRAIPTVLATNTAASVGRCDRTLMSRAILCSLLFLSVAFVLPDKIAFCEESLVVYTSERPIRPPKSATAISPFCW